MKKIIVGFLIIGIFLISFWFKQKSPSKVYDCFPFFNELELLEVRLNELNDVVNYFVIVENPLTFTGNDKPLYFEQNKQRFSKFLDKIIYVVGPKRSSFEYGAWDREIAQRNDITLGLKKAKNKDIIIISDLDEIPRAESIAKIKKILLEKKPSKKKKFKYVKLEYKQFIYNFNRLRSEVFSARAMATTFKQVKKIFTAAFQRKSL